MVGFTVTKGSTVEVSSDEPGFYGAWYVATIVDILEASPTKRSSSKKKKNIKKAGYLIKYHTLYEDEDWGEHLTEVVALSSVRPLPPTMAEDGGGGGDFEVNDVIDADHRDGWWIGVIKKVIVDGENKKFVVEFENPPEVFEFNASQLRPHVDWVDGIWVVPPKKTAELELGEQNTSGFTTPLKGTLPTGLENQSMGPKVSPKKRSRSQKQIESNGKMVGKVDGSGTATRGKRSQSSTGKGYKKVKVPVMEKCGSQATNQNSVLLDQEMIATETFSNSQQKKKRGRPAKLKFQVTSPNSVQKEKEKEKAWERDCSGFHEEPIDVDDQPLSSWYRGLQNPSLLKRSSCPIKQHVESGGALNQAMVNNGGSNESNGAMNQAIVNDGATDEPNGAPNQADGGTDESSGAPNQAVGATDEPNGAPNQAVVNNGATNEPNGALNQAVVNDGATDELNGSPNQVVVNNGAPNQAVVNNGAIDEPNGALNQAIVNNDGTDEPNGALNQAIVNNGSTNEPMGTLNQAVVNNGVTDEPNGAPNQAIVNNGSTNEPVGALNQAVVVNSGGTDEPMGALNEAIVVNNGGTTTDYQQEWPFIKRSIVWAAIESLESYQKPPQKPHFSPLSEINQDLREGLAIARMVTFSTVFQMISKIQLSDPTDIINNSLEALVDLEAHGFDVNLLRARLNELLYWKLKVDQHNDKLKKLEEQVEKFKVEKCQVEDKIKQLKLNIKELEEQMTENVKMKNVKDDQITNLQSNSNLVSNEIMGWKLAFENLKASRRYY